MCGLLGILVVCVWVDAFMNSGVLAGAWAGVFIDKSVLVRV